MICFDHCELLSSLRTEADPSVVGSSTPLVVDTGWDSKRGTRASVATLFALLDTSPRHHVTDPSYHGSDPVTHPLRLSEHPYHTSSVQHSVTHHSSSRFPSHSPSSTTHDSSGATALPTTSTTLYHSCIIPNQFHDNQTMLYRSSTQLGSHCAYFTLAFDSAHTHHTNSTHVFRIDHRRKDGTLVYRRGMPW